VGLTTALKRAVVDAAERDGVSVACWVRRVLYREAGEAVAGWRPMRTATMDETVALADELRRHAPMLEEHDAWLLAGLSLTGGEWATHLRDLQRAEGISGAAALACAEALSVAGVTLRISIPGPPQPKQRPRRNRRTGRWYTPPRTGRYEAHVASCAAAAAMTQGWERTDAPVRMVVEVRWPDRRRRDIDNLAKSVMDGLTKAGSVWVDDAQVCELTVRTSVGREDPGAEVTVEVLL
jgi:Holliday junction resolvase RusA-like endonuclease